jgi:hypothetical protein
MKEINASMLNFTELHNTFKMPYILYEIKRVIVSGIVFVTEVNKTIKGDVLESLNINVGN